MTAGWTKLVVIGGVDPRSERDPVCPLWLQVKILTENRGTAEANVRELKSCFSQIFNFKLGRFLSSAIARPKSISGWKTTKLKSVFFLLTSVFLLPHGTTLTAFADVDMDVARC